MSRSHREGDSKKILGGTTDFSDEQKNSAKEMLPTLPTIVMWLEAKMWLKKTPEKYMATFSEGERHRCLCTRVGYQPQYLSWSVEGKKCVTRRFYSRKLQFDACSKLLS